MADNKQAADLASLPQSIAEDSLSQSELSPLAPAFSSPFLVSSEASNGSGNNQNQWPLCIRNPTIMLNYDRFGSPSDVQHASVQPLRVMSNYPMYNMPTTYSWCYSLDIRNQLYPRYKTVAYQTLLYAEETLFYFTI